MITLLVFRSRVRRVSTLFFIVAFSFRRSSYTGCVNMGSLSFTFSIVMDTLVEEFMGGESWFIVFISKL